MKHEAPVAPVLIRHSEYPELLQFRAKYLRDDFGVPPIMALDATRAEFMGIHKKIRYPRGKSWQVMHWQGMGLRGDEHIRQGRIVSPLPEVWNEYWKDRQYWPFLVHTTEDHARLNCQHLLIHWAEMLRTLPTEWFVSQLIALQASNPERYDTELYARLQERYPHNGFHTRLERQFFESVAQLQGRLLTEIKEYKPWKRPNPSHPWPNEIPPTSHEVIAACLQIERIHHLYHHWHD